MHPVRLNEGYPFICQYFSLFVFRCGSYVEVTLDENASVIPLRYLLSDKTIVLRRAAPSRYLLVMFPLVIDNVDEDKSAHSTSESVVNHFLRFPITVEVFKKQILIVNLFNHHGSSTPTMSTKPAKQGRI